MTRSLVLLLGPVIALLAACDPPVLALRFTLTDGPSQQCISSRTGSPTTDCSEVTMICDSVLSIRIVPPDQPMFPYLSVCEAPPPRPPTTLCSIASVTLPQPTVPIPEQVLEVQIAVFKRDTLSRDADGNYICPRVEFAANNLPESAVTCFESDPTQCPPRPAIGGRAYYYPGDEETVVPLGCTELSLLDGPACASTNTLPATATVNDFDTWVPVSATTATRLTVSIGEPKPDQNNLYSLTGTQPLMGPSSGVPPTWSGELAVVPQNHYCVEVFEDVPQATRSVVCRPVPSELSRIDIVGALLAKDTLDDILDALDTPVFPAAGLVVGVVLDQFNNPVAGARVTPTCAPGQTCTVQYLSADRRSLTTDATSSNGIWLSQDSPFGTRFSRAGQVQPVFGGLVQGKVTIVVLQESAPVGN